MFTDCFSLLKDRIFKQVGVEVGLVSWSQSFAVLRGALLAKASECRANLLCLRFLSYIFLFVRLEQTLHVYNLLFFQVTYSPKPVMHNIFYLWQAKHSTQHNIPRNVPVPLLKLLQCPIQTYLGMSQRWKTMFTLLCYLTLKNSSYPEFAWAHLTLVLIVELLAVGS